MSKTTQSVSSGNLQFRNWTAVDQGVSGAWGGLGIISWGNETGLRERAPNGEKAVVPTFLWPCID